MAGNNPILLWAKGLILRPEERIEIFDANDPRVTSGEYDVFGFTPKEKKAWEKKLQEQTDAGKVEGAGGGSQNRGTPSGETVPEK